VRLPGFEMTYHLICPVAAPCNVIRCSGIMTLNLPGGSTLQCGRWLWDDMPLNSPKRPPYWNSTSGFNFNQFNQSPVDMSFCTSLRNCIQIGPPSAEKKWRHVDFQDSGSQSSWILGVQSWVFLKSPGTTSYKSSVETIALNCLVFEKILFFLYFGDRQTDEQMDSADN